jgi:hypothetical protein
MELKSLIGFSSLTKRGFSQNNRICSSENPHVLHEKPLHCQKIGVRCAVSRRRIVGPIFFETTMNSPVYQDIITQFIALLEVDELECWLQQARNLSN